MYKTFDVVIPGQRILTVVLIAISLLAGCSSTPKVIKVDEARVQEFSRHGYDPGIDYATAVVRFSLKVGNEFIPAIVVQPARAGKYPLVVYLPGLGESNESAKDLRNAWAKSGYVVLSIQPLKEDEDVWSSEAAHRADFSSIRQERYSSDIISGRLNVISQLIETLKSGIASGDSNFDHIDLSQLAIIGFDAGANSAMVVSGEDVPNVSKEGLSIHPRILIALSPHSVTYNSAFDTRYQNINIPALSVTSDIDDDTHGNESISLHQIPFQHMPPGNKYLLLLSGAPHSLIGNEDTGPDVQTAGNSENKPAERENTGSKSGQGRGGRHGKKESGGGGDEKSSFKREAERSPTQRAKAKVAIAQVTTAFLNAFVKNDRFAIEWLDKDAQPWLYDIGQLQKR